MKTMENCLVICSQPIGDAGHEILHDEGLVEGALRIAVDGGLTEYTNHGLEPHIWVGDGDSSKKGALKKSKFEKVLLKREKDYSDLEFALHVAGRMFLEGTWQGNLVLLGAQGGRFDHDVVNLLTVERWLIELSSFAKKEKRALPPVLSYGPHGVWMATLGKLEFMPPKGSLFSVFSFDPKAKISIDGAKYSVMNLNFDHSSRGLSNVSKGKPIRVTALKSPLFVICPSEDHK